MQLALVGSLGETLPDHPEPQQDMQSRLRTALIAIFTLVTSFVLLAVLVPIGGAVIGSGQVGVESRVKRVAHPSGGIISEVYVKNGDRVAKGDLLIRFDDTVSGTDARLSMLSVHQLLAQRARLEAERLGSASIEFPAELTNTDDPGAKKAMDDEVKLFAIQKGERGGMLAQLQQRIAQYSEQINGYRGQIHAIRQQQALLGPERAGLQELWQKRLVTIARLNQLERAASEMDGSIAALQSQIAQTQARISEVREQMIQLNDTRRSAAGELLTQTNASLNQQQMRSANASDLQERMVIRAPYSGIVDNLQFASIGDVVRPAESIMEIVPDNDSLIVEAMISPADIDRVHDGQSARLRFTAYNAATSPEIGGVVAFIAPDLTVDAATQRRFYKVQVRIDQSALKRHPEITLKPGMPTEVYIETASRSMLSYLTKPMRDQFARAFRDE